MKAPSFVFSAVIRSAAVAATALAVAAPAAQAQWSSVLRNAGSSGSASGTAVYEWQGRVDQEIRLQLRDDRSSVIRVGPRETIANGGRALSAIPRQPGQLTVQRLEGRGSVDVIQQPSASNGYTATVRLVDGDAGAGQYHFVAYWQPTGGRGGYGSTGGNGGYDNSGRGGNGSNGGYDNGRGGYGSSSDVYGRDGYDRNGYDRNGYDRGGFDRNGYDRNGYDRGGYNRSGRDRRGGYRNGNGNGNGNGNAYGHAKQDQRDDRRDARDDRRDKRDDKRDKHDDKRDKHDDDNDHGGHGRGN